MLVIAKAGWKTQPRIFPAPSVAFMFEIFHTENKIEKNDPREKNKASLFLLNAAFKQLNKNMETYLKNPNALWYGSFLLGSQYRMLNYFQKDHPLSLKLVTFNKTDNGLVQ